MEDNNYLDYIRVLRDREDSKGKRAGITTWGLLVAFIYVCWQIIPELGKVQACADGIAYAAGLLGYMQLAVIFTIVLIDIPWQTTERGKFGHRISMYRAAQYPQRGVLVLLLTMILPIVCQQYGASVLSPNLGKWLYFQNIFNTVVLISIFIAIILVVVAISYYRARSEFPSPIAFVAQGRNAEKWGSAVFWILALILSVGNILSLYLYAQAIPPASVVVLLQFSFDVLLVILILVMLLKATSVDETSTRLEALERDAVLHGLEQTTIRERIQEELLGFEAGEWLRKKISLVRSKASRVCEIAHQSNQVLKEIQDINPEYVLEQQGRINHYIDTLTTLFDEYRLEFDKFEKWLNSVQPTAAIYKDAPIMSLLMDVRNQLGEVRKEIGAEVPQALSNMKTALSKVKENVDELASGIKSS